MSLHRLVLATTVDARPERCFEFLLDFPSYPEYTDVLEDVRREGDGGVGTEYHLDVSWWRLSRTVRSRVTAIDQPERIDWRLLGDLAVRGHWAVKSTDPGATRRTRVRLHATYDAAGSSLGTAGLAGLHRIPGLRERLAQRLSEEATLLLERAVEELEGERRPVDLDVVRAPDGLLAPE